MTGRGQLNLPKSLEWERRGSEFRSSAAFCSIFTVTVTCVEPDSLDPQNTEETESEGAEERGETPSFTVHCCLLHPVQHTTHHTHLPSVQPQGVDDSRAGPFYVIGADGVQPPGGSRSHTELLSQQQSMNSSNLRRVLFYNLFDEWAYIFSWFPLTHIPVGGKTGGNFVYFSH